MNIFAPESEREAGSTASLFLFFKKTMIDKKFLITHAEQFLEGSDNYLVDVTINPGNIISIEIDNDDGVNINDCVIQIGRASCRERV